MYNSIRKNKGKFIGGLLGLIAAVMVLTIGFFRTFFIYMSMALGILLGAKHDEGITFKELVKSFINRINKEYM